MLFHVRRPVTKELIDEGADRTQRREDGARGPTYDFSPIRVVLALVYLMILGGLALGCWQIGFEKGAETLLSLIEVSAGAIGGILFGEKMALGAQGAG